MGNFKETKVYEFCKKNKLWLIPLAAAVLIGLIVMFTIIYNHNYIKNEFVYAEQAQAMEDYETALKHVDNILHKDHDNEEALQLKQELTLSAENKAKAEAAEVKKQQDIQTLINTYVFDGELAVKILKVHEGMDSGWGADYIYAYSQRSNDARGYYFYVAYKTSEDSDYWSYYKVSEDGTVESAYMGSEEASTYTIAKNSESVRKDSVAKENTEKESAAKESAVKESTEKESAEKESTGSAPSASSDSGTQTYKSSYGYSIEYPSKYTVSSLGEYMDFVISDPTSGSNINVTTTQVDPSEDMENMTQDGFEQAMESQGLSIDMTSFSHTTVNGLNAIKAEYTLIGNSVTQMFYWNDKYNYIVTYTKVPGTDSSVDSELRNVLTTLKEN